MKALTSLDLNNVVFIDIETVAAVETLTKESPLWNAWDYKMRHGRDPIGGTDHAGSYKEQASLYAEFGKIVCITIGKIVGDVLKVKSYVDADEAKLLQAFCTTLSAMTAQNKHTVLCGHAIKGFDIPWIMRRCLINQIELPTLIDTGHLKPWETTAVDTSDLWKGTGFNGGSLIAIAAAMGLSNPKDELAGYQTTACYYGDKDWAAKIQKYCEKDVLTVANVVRKCRYEPIVTMGDKPVEPVVEAPILTKLFNGGKYTLKDAKYLTKEYAALDETAKPAMVILLRSIVDKSTSFTEDNLQAIINFKPKTKDDITPTK